MGSEDSHRRDNAGVGRELDTARGHGASSFVSREREGNPNSEDALAAAETLKSGSAGFGVSGAGQCGGGLQRDERVRGAVPVLHLKEAF